MNKKVFKKLLFFAVFVASLVLVWESGFGGFVKSVKNFPDGVTIESVKKEFIKSGKLVFDTVNSDSFLTHEGVLVNTNLNRTQNGLRPLLRNQRLDIVARLRLDDMFSGQYFEHISPSGDSASVEAGKIGYDYITIGENIALGNFKDDSELVNAWMDSPGHRANVLNSKFTDIGIAVGKGRFDGRETWIAVQVFAKPLTACPSVDTTLKAFIDSEVRNLEEMKEDLNRRKSEIDSMESNGVPDRQEYRDAINEYNSLVAVLNQRVSELQTKIGQYNKSVQDFNICLKS